MFHFTKPPCITHTTITLRTKEMLTNEFLLALVRRRNQMELQLGLAAAASLVVSRVVRSNRRVCKIVNVL